jgi:Tfp pilus assembly protein PilX
MYKLTTATKPQPLQEQGLVSITITVILMLIISITVLSFAQIIRREQRQALDNQLSSQAFYAAESGINDARNFIQQNFNGTVPDTKTECRDQGVYHLNYTIDDTTKTGYTCVLVTGSPKNLQYDLSSSASSKVFPIDTGSNVIDKLDLTWSPSTKNSPLNGCLSANSPTLNDLPKAANWPCEGYGIVRIDIVPANVLNRQSFMAETFTAFLTPANGSGATTINYNASSTNVNAGGANQGARPFVKCTAVTCAVSITGMAPRGGSKYYARVSAIYRDTTFTIAAKDQLDVNLPMNGAQVLLDSTGQSQDVLRRIQVRVPLVTDSLHADYGIESTDSMCKQFTSFPGYPNGGC